MSAPGNAAAILRPTPLDIEDITRTLDISQKLVAQIVGTTARTVSRWKRGETARNVPRPEASLELRKLARLQWLLKELIPTEDIGSWMRSPNPGFQGCAPIDMLADGRIDEVIGVLEAVAEGGLY